MKLNKEGKTKIINELKTHETDTGSSDVQIGIITEEISNLTKHLDIHKKDFSARRSMLKLVGKRSALLKYLSRYNNERYLKLIAKLELRK